MLVKMAALIPADDGLPPISVPPVGAWAVADRLGVVLDSGLSADEAAERLRRNGPNALPVEPPPPIRRCADIALTSPQPIGGKRHGQEQEQEQAA
jgi:Cation transporter/ATPase, N-terminus